MSQYHPHLFAWETDDMPELQRLTLILEHLPSQPIIAQLEARLGRGRNDYPSRALIAGVVFGHDSVNSLLRELARNVQLAQLCGFNPLPLQSPPKITPQYDAQGRLQKITAQTQPLRSSLPSQWNFSRFLKQLFQLEADPELVSEMIVTLRHQLMAEVADFGRHLGYDGKALPSHSTGRTLTGKDRTSDPDADWGRHETRGQRQDGTRWEKVKKWFGYRVHLIADRHYEIPVAVQLRKASESGIPCLRDSMLPQLFEQSPQLAERGQQFTADRGLECSRLKASLYDEHEIRPLIDHKMLWRQEKQDHNYDPAVLITRRLNDGVRTDNIVYDEHGQVHCLCSKTKLQREVAFCGFEKDRKTLKYRGPAAVYGLDCEGYQECHQQHRAGAHLFASRPRLPFRAALSTRSGENENPRLPCHGHHNGAGSLPGRPKTSDALFGQNLAPT